MERSVCQVQLEGWCLSAQLYTPELKSLTYGFRALIELRLLPPLYMGWCLTSAAGGLVKSNCIPHIPLYTMTEGEGGKGGAPPP